MSYLRPRVYVPYYWGFNYDYWSVALPEVLVMPDVVSGLFISTGVILIATGLSEISRFFTSTTELEGPVLDLKVFDNVYRVSALLRNPGSVIVKDAKAVMELEGLNSRLLIS